MHFPSQLLASSEAHRHHHYHVVVNAAIVLSIVFCGLLCGIMFYVFPFFFSCGVVLVMHTNMLMS